ncbi:MAG: GerMN domain-containing protein [Desulfobacteraceae bacterium]|nr:GerMN domain-containing protein [Desulfobacteraceae bacterium]
MKRGLICLFFLILIVSICFPQVSGLCQEGSEQGEVKQQQLFEGFLYFIDKDGRHLKSVEQKFAAGLNSHDLGLAITEALIKGPSSPELGETVPAGTKVNALFITDDGRAFIDFDKNIQTLGDYSAQTEMLAIYSIVNSLILNIEKINRVKILIQGETVQTLSGHIDLDCFYEANMLIVK